MLTYSVIIPVYKVEAYLPACVDSVLAQDTASKYEIILVDDGSPDNSGAICDGYAAKHPNIRVIHQENKGLSGARNSGIELARGEYLLFLDSDDLWAPEMLPALDRVIGTKADVICFGCRQFTEDGSTLDVHPISVSEGPLPGRDYLTRLLEKGLQPRCSSCTNAYRRDFFSRNHLRYNEACFIAEDWEMFWRMMPLAEQVICLDRLLYLYRAMRAGSITCTPTPAKLLLRLQMSVDTFRKYPYPRSQTAIAMRCSPSPI